MSPDVCSFAAALLPGGVPNSRGTARREAP